MVLEGEGGRNAQRSRQEDHSFATDEGRRRYGQDTSGG
jgi:hypothetical protein